MNGRILLVDGNSILNRAFYGIGGGKVLTNRQGFATNAIHGFMTILLKYISQGGSYDHVAVAFDLKAPTFRHAKYTEYKAGRRPMPDELAMQFPKMKEILWAWGISCVELAGYEADDIIGTLSAIGQEAGYSVTILTGDRDSYQLVSHSVHISMPSTKGGKTTYEEITPQVLMEKYGLTPAQMIDLKSLMGDSSDNIPGVKGVGEKTALALVQQYGSLDNIYQHLDEIPKAALKAKLTEGRDQAYLSYWLGTICRQVPGVPSIDDIALRPMDRGQMYALLEELELNKMIKALDLSPSDAPITAKDTVQVRTMDTVALDVAGLDNLRSAVTDAGVLYVYADITGSAVNRTLSGIAFSDGRTAYAPCGELAHSGDSGVWTPLFNTGARLVTNDLKGLLIWLSNMGCAVDGEFFDTEIAAYMCDSTRRHPYTEICMEYLGAAPESQGEQQISLLDMPESTDGSICADRVMLMPDLEEALVRAMEDVGVYDLFLMVEMPLAKVLAEMELRGMDVDRDALEQLGRDYDRQISALEESIYEMAGERFNINSTAQLGQVLFEKLGLKHGRKTKTGYSTDAEVLDKLADEHPIVPQIIKYRQLTKLNNTYARGLYKFIDPKTGRIHTTFNQTVTATGRLSSQDPNLQNIPVRTEEGREIRKVFVCKPGEVLVSADYSQIELRVLAHVANDPNMREIFQNGGDIHTDTAAKVFAVPRDQVTYDMRRAAKAVNFGIVYGISEFGLSKDLGISYGEAKSYIETYLENFEGVRNYMSNVTREAAEKGYVTTFMGRRRYIPELKSRDHNIRSFGERVALNAPIQGGASDIIKVAMIRVSDALRDSCPGAELVLQVHDELIVRCAREDYPMVVNILRDNMENAVSLSVPMTVDISSGHSWFEV